jgi:hypothetical protein
MLTRNIARVSLRRVHLCVGNVPSKQSSRTYKVTLFTETIIDGLKEFHVLISFKKRVSHLEMLSLCQILHIQHDQHIKLH